MLRAAALLAAIAFLSSCGGDGGPPSGSDFWAAAVKIEAYGCSGSAPAVGSGTLIGGDRALTVAHTLAGAGRVDVVLDGGRVLPAVVAGIDFDQDLAVLRVDGLDHAELRLIDVEADATGTLLGFGSGAEVEPRALPFEIARPVELTFTRDRDAVQARPGYEVNVAIAPGDSGAGLFVGADLAGVIFASSTEDLGRSWATAVEPVRTLRAQIAAGTAATATGNCIG